MPGSRGGPRTPSPGRERVGGAPAGAGRGGPREGHHQARRSRQRPPAHISQDHSAAGTLGGHAWQPDVQPQAPAANPGAQAAEAALRASLPTRPSIPALLLTPLPRGQHWTRLGASGGRRLCVLGLALHQHRLHPGQLALEAPLADPPTLPHPRACLRFCVTRVHVYTCSPAYARLCGLWLLGLGLNSEELFCKLLVRRGGQRLVPPGDRPQRAWGPPGR